MLGLGADDGRVTLGPLIRVTRGLDRIACSLKPREESRDGAPRGERARKRAVRVFDRIGPWRAPRPKRAAAVTPQRVARLVMRMRLSALRPLAGGR